MLFLSYDFQPSEEARITSGVPQRIVLGPLLFLAYVNDIWRNIEFNILLFVDDCLVYTKITDSSDFDKLQTDLNRLGEWAVKNEMKINPGKREAVSFTKIRVKERRMCYFGDQLIPEASNFKYLGTVIAAI